MSYPKLGAIGIVIHEEKVLLVQRSKEPDAGLWGFPGGHVELGETALVAAAREVQEEAGLEVEPLRYLTNVDVIVKDGDQVKYHFLLAAVLCRYVSGTVQAADDAMDARWVTIAELSSLKTSSNVQAVAKQALAAL